ncbi:MAG: hypothetical protein LQ338_007982 [Usnochroma carphineum]|nr:MAG: hypothetical protein LQ338_007982 [Usnochroma carphineum]
MLRSTNSHFASEVKSPETHLSPANAMGVRSAAFEELEEKPACTEGRRDESIFDSPDTSQAEPLISEPAVPTWQIIVSLTLLFLNYFLAQYDKFILSYFQDDVIGSLKLSQSSYGLLSGYATGIVYALLALPTAYIADYTSARVWVLSVAAAWWSLCAIFQGLSNNFWQILLARIGMGIGQAPVEALSVSLISDFMGKRYVFLGASVLYVGVYIGEAVSGQIAVAFTRTHTPWNTALIAIGIAGIVIAVLIRILVREPRRQSALVQSSFADHLGEHKDPVSGSAKVSNAVADFKATWAYVARMRSFWILVLSASFRQLSGNVFGYYMPTYLSTLYSSRPNLLSRYGIIVGVVGSVAVILGGLLTSLFWKTTKTLPLFLTGIGGMVSSIFVLLMIFSKSIAGGNDDSQGIRTLYGTMSAAYLTAELWLGAINSLIALLLPPRYKTFGLAIWAAIQVLVYSSGPEIIGLALRNVDSASQAYLDGTKIALAVIIPVGYWLAGVGFLMAINPVKRDLDGDFIQGRRLGRTRRAGFGVFAFILGGLVVGLFVASIVYRA